MCQQPTVLLAVPPTCSKCRVVSLLAHALLRDGTSTGVSVARLAEYRRVPRAAVTQEEVYTQEHVALLGEYKEPWCALPAFECPTLCCS